MQPPDFVFQCTRKHCSNPLEILKLNFFLNTFNSCAATFADASSEPYKSLESMANLNYAVKISQRVVAGIPGCSERRIFVPLRLLRFEWDECFSCSQEGTPKHIN